MIASEKAGIIQPRVPVVFNTGDDVADKVIEDRAEELRSRHINVKNYNFRVDVDFDEVDSLSVPYQKDNAKTAITAFEIMLENGSVTISNKIARESVDKLDKEATDKSGTESADKLDKETTDKSDAESVDKLFHFDKKSAENVIERGLEGFDWPGRMEYMW